MKAIIILMMLPFLALSQSNEIGFNVGTSISPIISIQKTKDFQELAFMPNVNLSFGSDVFRVVASFGVVSRLLVVTGGRYTYASSGYFINTITNEQGAEIGAGARCSFGKNKAITVYCGASVGMVASKKGDPIINICPVNIGVFVNILKVE
jgi:hypothetical protein